MSSLTLAVTGCGGVSRMHFEAYVAHPDRVRVVAACDPDAARVERARGEYAIPALFDPASRQGAVERWENPYAGASKPESVFTALEELLSAIESRAEPSNSGRDNLKTIALLEAAYRSAEGGRTVHLTAGSLP